MKNGIRLLAIFVALAGVAVAQSQQQSIVEAARKTRAKSQQKHLKVWTNEDLVPSQTAATPDQSKPAAKAGESEESEKSGKAADEAKAKAIGDWQKKLSDQKSQIEKLQNEIAALEKKNQERATAYYGDVGTRLRDSKKWTEDQMKLDKELADKKKELQDAQGKLTDMQDEARRAGVPHVYD